MYIPKRKQTVKKLFPIFSVAESGGGKNLLTLKVEWIGNDLCAWLTGGKAHIGATALALKDSLESDVLVHELPGHREGELAKELAFALSNTYHCTTQAIVGIHYDNASPQMIANLVCYSRDLIQMAVKNGQEKRRVKIQDN